MFFTCSNLSFKRRLRGDGMFSSNRADIRMGMASFFVKVFFDSIEVLCGRPRVGVSFCLDISFWKQISLVCH
jgi:hypothetical protein